VRENQKNRRPALMDGRADGIRPLPLGSDSDTDAGRTHGSWSSSTDIGSSTESGARLRDNRSGSGKRSGSDIDKKAIYRVTQK